MAKSDLIHVQVEGNVLKVKPMSLLNYWKKVGKL